MDTLLSRLRETLRNEGTDGFPTDAIETAMTTLGKSLRFEEAEIEEILELRYGRPRTFAALAMLYPGLDLTKAFHIDHLFPRSRFTRAKLLKDGIPYAQVDEYLQNVDALPNLQLLQGLPNLEKQATLPADWLSGPHFTSEETQAAYIKANDLQDLASGLENFLHFFSDRRKRMAIRLRALLAYADAD